MKNKKTKIWLATGGTGGHIFPAMSVAHELKKHNVELIVSTDKRGRDLVKKSMPEKTELVTVWASGIMNKSIFSKIRALILIGLSTAALAIRFLFLRPKIIVAFGGYASIPVVLAGRVYKIPTLLHEQNAHVGRANYLSMRYCKLVMTSFKSVKNLRPGAKTAYTGLPVRNEFNMASQYPYNFEKNGNINILVTGGSLGAKILLDTVPPAIATLPDSIKKRIRLTQQVSSEHINGLRKFYEKNDIRAALVPFINDMADQMAKSHLIIGRSGASTLVEIMTVGRPAILVPLMINPDQLANAKSFEKIGGGITIEQSKFTPKFLEKTLSDLFSNPTKMNNMAKRAKTENHAVENIVKQIIMALKYA